MSGATTVGAWLDRQLDDVDARLVRLVMDAVPAELRARPVGDAPAELGRLAVERTRRMLACGCNDRAAAPDLLLVDALVTYACEASAELDGDGLQTIDDLLGAIASLASGSGEMEGGRV